MTRPNILFLMTDHTNAQALAPNSPCLTPNLDALAKEGVQLGRCYTTNAICSPARASLMTALYPSSHGMWDCTHTQRKEWVDVPSDRFTYFSNNLSDAGYYNGYFGKWHVEQSGKLEDFGWHEYDTKVSGLRHHGNVESLVMVENEGYRDCQLAGINLNDEDIDHPAFTKGIDFIRRAVDKDQPFCCFVSTIEPHDAYEPPKRFYDMYDIESVPLSPSLHDDLSDKPEVVRRMQAVWGDLTDDQWRKVTAAYWAVITYIDWQVGQIIEVLKETGQYDNTIIVFTSDHGDMLGGHGLITKGVGTSYEEVYNIPLIIRSPKGLTGKMDSETVASLVDIAPTLLDLCGADPLHDAQGRSLKPVLNDEHELNEWTDGYAEFFGQRFVYTQRMVWHKNWKYVFSPGGIDELYELESDPHERKNLADDPAYEDTLKSMCRRMWKKVEDIDDKSICNSHYATLRTAPVGPLST